MVAAIVAYAYLAVISVMLAVIDARTHRLPNRIVLPAYPALAVLLAIACATGIPWTSLGRAALGGVVMFAFFALLRILPGGAMGGGDVKLAGVLGIATGFAGWGALAVGAFAGFVLGGLYGLVLLLARRAGPTTAIAFGPFMIAGAWIGLLAGGPLAAWSLGGT